MSLGLQPDVVQSASDAARLFDTLLLASSVMALLFAATVGVLLLVVVARLTSGRDARGLAFLMIACGLAAVALGLVAFESGPWSATFNAFATASPDARAALVAATSTAMKPFATAAILVAMAIPVTLVPAGNKVRLAIAAVAIVVLGVTVFMSAAAHKRVESISVPT